MSKCKTCENCCWHEDFCGACCNPDSEWYEEFMSADDGCKAWEAKEDA